MNLRKKIRQLPISTLLVANVLMCLIAIILKIIYISLLYNPESGLFNHSTVGILLNSSYYIIIFAMLLLNILSSISTLPFFKTLNKNRPTVVGYSLFLTSIMFTLQGLIGFYNHFTTIFNPQNELSIFNPENDLISPTFMEYFTTFIPFFTDALCIVCAFSFYAMAMEYFKDDDEPQKCVNSSIIPAIWGALTLLQILIFTNDKISVQSENEQVLFGVFTCLFTYYTAKRFYTIGKKISLFALIIEISYSTISIAIVVPYLILQLFNIGDSFSATPYFALFGIAIYSISSMLNYTISASVLQKKRKNSR